MQAAYQLMWKKEKTVRIVCIVLIRCVYHVREREREERSARHGGGVGQTTFGQFTFSFSHTNTERKNKPSLLSFPLYNSWHSGVYHPSPTFPLHSPQKTFKTFSNIFTKRNPLRPATATPNTLTVSTDNPPSAANLSDTTVQGTPVTPSPPSSVPSPDDTPGSNASEGSEMEPDRDNSRKNVEAESDAVPAARETPCITTEGDNTKKRETKFSVMDQNTAIGHLLSEHSDIETEDIQVFHWHITDWKGLASRTNSPEFQAGGYPWRILLFPRGNNIHDSVSVYLEVADPAKNNLSDGWHVCAHFSLVLSNPNDPTNYFANHAHHRFSNEEIDWGFTRFYDIKSLSRSNSNTGRGPFLVDNKVVISVFIRVVKDETGVLWHSFVNYNSRKETGYVGIRNQGATCYMNSMLQSLYCTNSFRKAVYQIPTDNDSPTESVSLALQRCFYNIQYSDEPIDTTELTKSFGWDIADAFRQHDVQEFNRVLQDNLEEKMKGTPADGAISKLFLGRMKSYIKCINVDYESSRVEDYYDIQLNVKGCKTLEESFKDYVTIETLEGENKYMAEGHGLQDAKKGVIFESFPPVLHLQLKRFEYDFMHDAMVKVNDRQEFPEEINLDAFCEKKDDAESNNDPNDYVLHGVLVHSGDEGTAHYYALLKPEKDGNWFRFDDDQVIRVTRKEVFEDNFGSNPVDATKVSPPLSNSVRNNNARTMKRFTNAYMLVYIRKSKLDEVLGPVVDDDIPNHLKRRVTEERARSEKQKKDQEEMQLHVKVAVITDSVFKDRQEFDLAVFDDKNLDATSEAAIFKISKNDKVIALKQSIMQHYNLQPGKFRLWTIVVRANKTVRIDKLLSAPDEKQNLEWLRGISCSSMLPNGFAKLYLELPDSSTGNKLPNIKSDTLMVFLKYFDIKKQKIFGMGRIYVKSGEKIGDVVPTLRERAGLPKESSLALYEEVKPTVFDYMNLKATFQQSEIKTGDIICYQLELSTEEAKDIRARVPYATVREYFTGIYNRVVVRFKPKADKRGPEVSLTIDRRSTYSAVAKELAKELDADPQKILFISANLITKQPKDPLPFSPRMTLETMVPSLPLPGEYLQSVHLESIPPPFIYYEILDVNLADLESKRSLKVNVLYPTLRDETTVSVFVPRAGVADDIIQALNAKGKLSKMADNPTTRVYEAVDGKITKILSPDQPISGLGIKFGSVVYVEQIPKEEQTMDEENDRIVQVVSYHKVPNRFHGVPFLFVLKKGELFSTTRKRLQERTGISNKEWQKVKFVILKTDHGNPEIVPIEQDDCCLTKPGMIGAEDLIGLDRVDKSSRSRSLGSMFEGIVIRG
ncbi:hypothetical protein BX666DRAFT_1914369 [Dichotomocladium elegans]|nr:hypothetical protein BX666DRAFT_1914369 [Dichotomocladium elegans]